MTESRKVHSVMRPIFNILLPLLHTNSELTNR